MAAAAIAVAHRQRLDVPRDSRVCGFDDTPLATTIWPELTTIRQPVSAMAEGAVTMLADMIGRQRAGLPVGNPAPIARFRADPEIFGRAFAAVR